MQYSSEIQNMCPIQRGDLHSSAPIPVEGAMVSPKDVIAISGLSHGVGACAPQQGAAKLTLNVKNGIIEEALIETIGCSGMTQSAAMAAEILTGKTILEALNTVWSMMLTRKHSLWTPNLSLSIAQPKPTR